MPRKARLTGAQRLSFRAWSKVTTRAEASALAREGYRVGSGPGKVAAQRMKRGVDRMVRQGFTRTSAKQIEKASRDKRVATGQSGRGRNPRRRTTSDFIPLRAVSPRKVRIAA